MKSWLIPLAVALLVTTGALVLGDRARTAESVKPPRWEYKVMYYTDVAELGGGKDGASSEEYVAKGLNKLGEDGWELVAVTSYGMGRGDKSLYLKRTKAR